MWFEAEDSTRKFKFSALGLFAINYELLFAVIFIYLRFWLLALKI